MSASKLVVEKPARKRLIKLPINIHRRVLIALKIIKQNPTAGNHLKGKLAEYFKYRIGDYRIVYKFDSNTKTVLVVKIEHRQGVYR